MHAPPTALSPPQLRIRYPWHIRHLKHSGKTLPQYGYQGSPVLRRVPRPPVAGSRTNITVLLCRLPAAPAGSPAAPRPPAATARAAPTTPTSPATSPRPQPPGGPPPPPPPPPPPAPGLAAPGYLSRQCGPPGAPPPPTPVLVARPRGPRPPPPPPPPPAPSSNYSDSLLMCNHDLITTLHLLGHSGSHFVRDAPSPPR